MVTKKQRKELHFKKCFANLLSTLGYRSLANYVIKQPGSLYEQWAKDGGGELFFKHLGNDAGILEGIGWYHRRYINGLFRRGIRAVAIEWASIKESESPREILEARISKCKEPYGLFDLNYRFRTKNYRHSILEVS